MWAVVYENGMSLTIASEQTARSLAQAERDRGRIVSVRRVDDVVTHPRSAEEAARQADGLPEPELIRPAAEFASPEPISKPEPTRRPNRPHALNRHRSSNRCRPWHASAGRGTSLDAGTG